MSELPFTPQESEALSYCEDHPPQYESNEPSQDILTSIIESEYTRRIQLQRLDNMANDILRVADKATAETDYPLLVEVTLEMSRLYTDGAQACTELANMYKERTVQNTDIYTAMSRLTVDEFNRTYSSLRRDPIQQMRHEPAQEDTDRDDTCDGDALGTGGNERAADCTCDSSRSSDRLF
ncbi:uncharacterized protein N7479_005950 [Penicillium vulpinum]|uniref:Uncharacterized protein n=1 Tax=Penicillium vulpinum TaxID=29845 RepID=A0A1V6SDL5_9EURO|nr:uncharacterized protein N7479_005950 [Penicillium vulpinum]KAJ5958800.1 hypothetical protein N7479_005950 [Penicillium vulpinum]OQE12112.1 hypothetical protein PENVUL_c001G00226 [Penicillium vulpinum]